MNITWIASIYQDINGIIAIHEKKSLISIADTNLVLSVHHFREILSYTNSEK